MELELKMKQLIISFGGGEVMRKINKLNILGGFEWFRESKCHGSGWEMIVKIIKQTKYCVGNIGVLIISVALGLMKSRWSVIISEIVEL